MTRATCLFLITAVALTIAGCGSSDKDEYRYSDFYQEYRNSSGFVSLSISPSLLNLFVGKENTELRDFFRSLDDIKILIYDHSPDSVNYYAGMLRDRLSPTIYRDLMVAENGDEKVEFKVIDKDDLISELVMISSGKERLVTISITGLYELEKVKNITPYIDIDAADYLEKIITPNPR